MSPKIIFIIILLVAVGPIAATFWDGIPLVSQAKSLVQLVTGDSVAAKTTQLNFLNQAPLVSQIKSLVHVVKGEEDEATRTQVQFYDQFIEPLVDSAPVIGHIKGGILIAVGEKERGEQSIKSATTSTFAVLGGMAAGPAGAIGAAAVSDYLITAIDSDKAETYRPHGVVNYWSNIEKQNPGEHFDAITGLGANFVGGQAVRKGAVKGKTAIKEQGFGFDRGQGGRERRPLGDIYNIPLVDIRESSGSSSWQSIRDVPPALRDFRNPRVLQLAREESGLTKAYAEKLEPTDFLAVNDLGGTMNWTEFYRREPTFLASDESGG